MKALSTLIVFSLIITSCSYKAYDNNSIYRQNLPTFPQNYEAKVFMEDDSAYFDEPAVLIKSYNIDLHPIFTDQQVQDTLQIISKDFGYDLIVVKSVKDHSWDENDNSILEYMVAALAGTEVDESYTTYSSKRHAVDAYKYLSSIDYADKIVYSRKLQVIENIGDPTFIGEQFLLPSGLQQKLEGDKRQFDQIQRFSETYFLDEETEDWQYRWVDEETLIRINKRHKVKINFEKSTTGILPVEIQLKVDSPPFDKFNISIFYDQLNKITSKDISLGGKLYGSVDYIYDDNGRILKEVITYIFSRTNKNYVKNNRLQL